MVIDCNVIVNWKSNKEGARLQKQQLKDLGYWGLYQNIEQEVYE